MTLRRRPLALALLLGLAAAPVVAAAAGPMAVSAAPAAASTPSSASTNAATSGWVKTELYFAARRGDGRPVDGAAWKSFLAEVLTPAFPNGLTVYNAWGQMRRPDGVIRQQPTRVVVIVRPAEAAQERAIATVLRRYQSQFPGAEMMRLDIPVATPQFLAN